MRLSKRIIKHPATQKTIMALLSYYIRLVMLTGRIERHVHPESEPFLRGDENAIFAFWHGRMMMLPAFCPPKRQMHVLISHHRDGELISGVIAHFGQTTIHGSSSRGGSTAVKEILRALKKGDNISITPDGPRGPVQVAQGGIVAAAKISGAPVLPTAFSATSYRRMKSWDRFMLALPFSRIVFCVDAPIRVSRDIDETAEESVRQMIESRMNSLVARADALSGVSAAEPA